MTLKALVKRTYTILTNKLFKNVCFYNTEVFLSKIKIEEGNVLNADNAQINMSSIVVKGTGNEVYLEGGGIHKTHIRIDGVGCKVKLSSKAIVNNSVIVINGRNCQVSIGCGSTIGEANIVCMGKENYVNVGEECMFAEKVEIWASDSHPIFNSDSIVINPSKPILIGNHVWLGKYSKIMKGVVIGDNAVVGMGAIVTKDIEPNSLNVGSPSRKIRENINWNREYIRC